jgi:cytosine/creatinine deaminase
MPYCLIRKFEHRGAPRKVVFYAVLSGSLIKFSGNEEMLRQWGVQVDILEDPVGVALVAKYFREKPQQYMEDATGLAAVRKAAAPKA